jgi:hypothetical protein
VGEREGEREKAKKEGDRGILREAMRRNKQGERE